MGAVANEAKRSLGEVKRVTSEVERVMPAVALMPRGAWAQSKRLRDGHMRDGAQRREVAVAGSVAAGKGG